MMRSSCFVLAVATVFAPSAKALTMIEGVNFDVVLSAPEDVGDGLLATTLSAIGKGGAVLASFDGSIGANGGLHHEQFEGRGGVVFTTPTNGDTDSAVDSHFLLDVQLAIDPLSEQGDLFPSNVPGRDSFGAGITGFSGVLSGNVALNNPAAQTPIARLVFSTLGDFSFDFNLLPQSAIGGTENFTRVPFAPPFPKPDPPFPEPEPSTALLAVLGFAGFAARGRWVG